MPEWKRKMDLLQMECNGTELQLFFFAVWSSWKSFIYRIKGAHAQSLRVRDVCSEFGNVQFAGKNTDSKMDIINKSSTFL